MGTCWRIRVDESFIAYKGECNRITRNSCKVNYAGGGSILIDPRSSKRRNYRHRRIPRETGNLEDFPEATVYTMYVTALQVQASRVFDTVVRSSFFFLVRSGDGQLLFFLRVRSNVLLVKNRRFFERSEFIVS